MHELVMKSECTMNVLSAQPLKKGLVSFHFSALHGQ